MFPALVRTHSSCLFSFISPVPALSRCFCSSLSPVEAHTACLSSSLSPVQVVSWFLLQFLVSCSSFFLMDNSQLAALNHYHCWADCWPLVRYWRSLSIIMFHDSYQSFSIISHYSHYWPQLTIINLTINHFFTCKNRRIHHLPIMIMINNID